MTTKEHEFKVKELEAEVQRQKENAAAAQREKENLLNDQQSVQSAFDTRLQEHEDYLRKHFNNLEELLDAKLDDVKNILDSVRQQSSSSAEDLESKLLKLTEDYISRKEHEEILDARLSAKNSEDLVKIRYEHSFLSLFCMCYVHVLSSSFPCIAVTSKNLKGKKPTRC